MKKIFLLFSAFIVFSPLSYADDYGQRGNRWGHHEHHHHRQYYQPQGGYYQQQPAVIYQQQPPVIYSQPPQYGNSLRLSW